MDPPPPHLRYHGRLQGLLDDEPNLHGLSVTLRAPPPLSRAERRHAELALDQHAVVKRLRTHGRLAGSVHRRQHFGVAHLEHRGPIRVGEHGHLTTHLARLFRATAIQAQPL